MRRLAVAFVVLCACSRPSAAGAAASGASTPHLASADAGVADGGTLDAGHSKAAPAPETMGRARALVSAVDRIPTADEVRKLGPGGFDALAAIAEDPKAVLSERSRALSLLALTGDGRAQQALCRAASDEELAVPLRRSAIIALGALDTPPPARIARFLDDAEPDLRDAAARALGKSKDPVARAALEKRLAVEKDPQVRSSLERALHSRPQ